MERGLGVRGVGKHIGLCFGQGTNQKARAGGAVEEAVLRGCRERINSRHMFPASVIVTWTGGVGERWAVPGWALALQLPGCWALGSQRYEAVQCARNICCSCGQKSSLGRGGPLFPQPLSSCFPNRNTGMKGLREDWRKKSL